MALEKECPKCNVKIRRTAKVCGCGHKFTKHAKAKARQAKKTARGAEQLGPELLEPQFAVGRTDAGGAFMFWPRRGEHLVLTRIEFELLLATLAPKPDASMRQLLIPPLWSEPEQRRDADTPAARG